jgi:hypothetical protein
MASFGINICMTKSFKQLLKEVILEKKDRCYKRAKRTFKVFPSYNAASAIARCRRGEIWQTSKK